MPRDNTVDILVEWFKIQGWAIESGVILVDSGGKTLDLVSLVNFLEVKEKQGLRYTEVEG
jgi:hypothetical protein